MQDFVVLINLDNGVCHALARQLRAESIYCRILPGDISADALLASQARGVILAAPATGCPAHVPQMMDYLQAGLPMLCLGDAALTLCQTLGGELAGTMDGGIVSLTFAQQDPLFANVEDGEAIWICHQDGWRPGDRRRAGGRHQGRIPADAPQRRRAAGGHDAAHAGGVGSHDRQGALRLRAGRADAALG